MRLNLYQDSYANLRLAVRILAGAVVALAAVAVVLAVAYKRASDRIQYVLVPPVLSGKVYIGTEAVDKRYLAAMGVYVTDLLGSYTPADITRRKAELLSLTAPEIYQQVKKKLDKLEMDVKAERVTQVFTATDMRVSTLKKRVKKGGRWVMLSPSEGIIEATGVAARKIGLGKPLWKKLVRIQVNYRIRHGLFQLTGFHVYVKPSKKLLQEVMEQEGKRKSKATGASK